MPDPELELLCQYGTGTTGFTMPSPKWNVPVPAPPKSRATPRPVIATSEERQRCGSEWHPTVSSLSLQTAHARSWAGVHRGKTALHIAAERGSLRIVQLLLEHDVDVDMADASGRTALHYAARGAHAEVVTLLLAGGADSEARDGEGRSPLHVAADAECESVVRLLAMDGADLNAAIGWEDTSINSGEGDAS